MGRDDPLFADKQEERKKAMSMSPEPGQEKFFRKADKEKDHKKQLPGEDEDPLPPPTEPIHVQQKPNRNDPCPCGSGKKYKQCCGKPA